MSKLIYGSTEINLNAGTSPQVALETLKSVYPELANSSLTQNTAGDYVVTVATATKGAYAIYGTTKVELKAGVTPEAIKEVLSAIYPEIEGATTSMASNGDVTFTVATATKGAFAQYGDTKIELREGVSPEVVKETLSAIYPEIENATSSMDAQGNVIFTVATATKGAFAQYGDTKIELRAGVTPEVIKSTLSAIYPEIENATSSIDAQGNVTFTVATATKGN